MHVTYQVNEITQRLAFGEVIEGALVFEDADAVTDRVHNIRKHSWKGCRRVEFDRRNQYGSTSEAPSAVRPSRQSTERGADQGRGELADGRARRKGSGGRAKRIAS